MTADDLPRLVGVTQYDASTPRGGSGLPYYLFGALRRTGALDAVVQVTLNRPQRLATAAAAFHPDRSRWRERFWGSPLSARLLTRNARSRSSDLVGSDVVAVQAYGMFRIPAIPYVMVLDATLAAALRDAPQTVVWSGRPLAAMLRAEGRTYRNARHLFAMSRFVRDSLVDDHGVDPDRVTVTGAGVNFAPLPSLPSPGSTRPTGPPTIVFVGREFERKGGHVLLEAFAALRDRRPDVRLRIVGGHRGDPVPGVEYLGAIEDRNHLSALYAEADVFCLPSLFEPYGFVVLEAMAHGLPCVVTDVGGLRDTVVEGQTGHVVPPADPVALETALAHLLDDPSLAATWGAAGRRRIEDSLNWDAIARTIVQTVGRVRAAETAGG